MAACACGSIGSQNGQLLGAGNEDDRKWLRTLARGV